MQVLFDSSTPYFNLVQVPVQNLLSQTLLKVMTPLKDGTRFVFILTKKKLSSF